MLLLTVGVCYRIYCYMLWSAQCVCVCLSVESTVCKGCVLGFVMMRDDDTNGKPIKRVFVCTLLRTVWARVCVCAGIIVC